VNTHTPFDSRRTTDTAKIRRVEVYWHAVTYKTIAVYTLLVVAVIAGGLYFVVPQWYAAAFRSFSNAVTSSDADTANAAMNQTKFVNLDGKVQIKKVSSVQWVDADYRTLLDKGDLVQTGSDGLARITFADGTEYTVKPNTLVTVEENNVTRNQATTAVRINTGAVDLATPNWGSANSTASVTVEDATAQIHSNSRASVKADPNSKEGEIVVSSGSAEVQRGQERVELTQFQKASIPSTGPIQKSDVLAPPDLQMPRNLEPLIVDDPKTATVHFEWKAGQDAVSYALRISTNAMFTKTVKEAHVTGTTAEVTGLAAGDYFWNVTAMDVKKQSSQVSDTFKFSLVQQGKTQEMILKIDGEQLHGPVLEIYGRTEPGAALMVNGQPVPNIAPDGTFRYFTNPLEPGQHTIVVVGQNRRGGTAKQEVSIVVPK
jgi:hypothetical protein